MTEVAIAIPDELEDFVMQSVKSGRFAGPNDLVTTALYAFRDQAELESMKLARLRRDIDTGLRQLEQGESAEWDVEAFLGGMKAAKA